MKKCEEKPAKGRDPRIHDHLRTRSSRHRFQAVHDDHHDHDDFGHDDHHDNHNIIITHQNT